jgi:hypothetical protein
MQVLADLRERCETIAASHAAFEADRWPSSSPSNGISSKGLLAGSVK